MTYVTRSAILTETSLTATFERGLTTASTRAAVRSRLPMVHHLAAAR
jgi:hypothetical protein